MTANLTTDHYPIQVTTHIRLKTIHTHHTPRPKYEKCNDSQKQLLNEALKTLPNSIQGTGQFFTESQQTIQDNLPKVPPKEKPNKWSQAAQHVVDQKQQAILNHNLQQFIEHIKDIIKSKKQTTEKPP